MRLVTLLRDESLVEVENSNKNKNNKNDQFNLFLLPSYEEVCESFCDKMVNSFLSSSNEKVELVTTDMKFPPVKEIAK